VVMYSINPTQFLYREFHLEWEDIKKTLMHQRCVELRAGYAECLEVLETKLAEVAASRGGTVNDLSDAVSATCVPMEDSPLKRMVLRSIPRMPDDANYEVASPSQFAQFAMQQLRKYRSEALGLNVGFVGLTFRC